MTKKTANLSQGVSNWRDGLPAALAQHPRLAGQASGKSLADLLSGLLSDLDDAQTGGGVKAVTAGPFALPAEDASADEWDALYAQLGRPEGADKYAFQVDAKPDWYSDQLLDAMRQAMFSAGLSAKQANKLHDAFLAAVGELTAKRAQGDTQARDQLLAQLNDELGGDLEAFLQAASAGATALGIDEGMIEGLYQLGSAKQVLETFARIGEYLDEDSLAVSITGATRTGPGDARDELERLSLDKDHVMAFLNPGHPGHRQARAARSRLVRAANAVSGAMGGAAL